MFPAAFRHALEPYARAARLAVGIDVGEDAVRVVALRNGAEGAVLAGLALAPLPVDLSPQAASTALPGLLRSAVRSACRRRAWRPRRVVMAVSADAALVRTLPVEASAGAEEVAESVERVLRLQPVPASALRVAWAEVGATPAAPQPAMPDREPGQTAPRQVCLVAVRRHEVLARQTLALHGGLGRVLVDLDLFAALRGLLAGPPTMASDQPGARVGARVPLLIHVGSAAVRALAWPAGMPPALRVVPAPRVADVEALAACVAALSREVAASAGVPPDGIVLGGERALPDGLAAAVVRRAGLPAALADPFAGISLDAGAPPCGAAASPWLTAHGLALRGLLP
ncbi:MAG: hypothetical protein FGM40_03915 [Rhodocyclaceae bacterium]|nr:hypothetical protein [Rhodocyclaceae bacterium]